MPNVGKSTVRCPALHQRKADCVFLLKVIPQHFPASASLRMAFDSRCHFQLVSRMAGLSLKDLRTPLIVRDFSLMSTILG
jgi:hypothetical protein